MLRPGDHRAHIDRIIRDVLAACEPGALTRAAMEGSPESRRPAGIIAAGKAAGAMLRAAESVVGRPNEFVIVEPVGTARPRGFVADHPLPTERNLEAGAAVLNAARRWADPRWSDHFDSLVVLLSGGASALLTLPVGELGLEDVRAVTEALLRAGAPIQDLNTVRKHIDRLKGGRLAEVCATMPVRVFVLSDVLGDPLDVIGSGPCAPDPSTFTDALGVLDRHKVWHASERVTGYLERGARGEYPETAKPGDPVFARVTHAVVGNNETAVRAAAASAASLGFGAPQVQGGVTGEAAAFGRSLAQAAVRAAAKGGVAIVAGGETTVKVGAAVGRGGRNQEAALASAIEIDGREGVTIAAFATDGVDGPTDAAGAIVTGRTCDQARAAGLDPAAALAGHDSYAFFDALGRAGHPHLIHTGPTGTNVNDLAIALVDGPSRT